MSAGKEGNAPCNSCLLLELIKIVSSVRWTCKLTTYAPSIYADEKSISDKKHQVCTNILSATFSELSVSLKGI